VELSPIDQGSVNRARKTLADSIDAQYTEAEYADLLLEIGRLQSALQSVFRVIDGGEQS
jgi:hypothetical protein